MMDIIFASLFTLSVISLFASSVLIHDYKARYQAIMASAVFMVSTGLVWQLFTFIGNSK